MKGLRVTENAKEINFEEVCGKLESKIFPETITHRIPETNSSFNVKWHTTEKVEKLKG